MSLVISVLLKKISKLYKHIQSINVIFMAVLLKIFYYAKDQVKLRLLFFWKKSLIVQFSLFDTWCSFILKRWRDFSFLLQKANEICVFYLNFQYFYIFAHTEKLKRNCFFFRNMTFLKHKFQIRISSKMWKKTVTLYLGCIKPCK